MKWLTGRDALFLYSETPNTPIYTIKVAVVELHEDCPNFDIDVFRGAIRGRLHKLEPLSYELVNIPFKFHYPIWREHCDVDLTYHIRPWRLPGPGGRRELEEAVGQIAGTPLDRSRPLWEMYFVEGLAGKRIAVVFKSHHALADGIRAANLLARGTDLQCEPKRRPAMPDAVPTKRQLMRVAFADHIRQARRLPRALGYTAQGLARVRRSSRKLSAVLGQPVAPPPTFFNHWVASPERRFASTALALADVKQICKHLGVTINDLVLALSTGSLRQLLLRYDGKADPLLAFVPVSLDMSAARISGNYIDALSVALPVDLKDPLERLRRCHENAVLAKEYHQLKGPELVSRWVDCAVPVAVEPLFRLAANRKTVNNLPNVTITNIRGPFHRRGRVGGAVITELYSAAYLPPWSGLVITVMNYADQLSISVLTDGATVEDPHEVTDAMNAEFIQIRRSTGLFE